MAMAASTERYRTWRVVGLASSAALGGFLFGYDSAVINGASSAIKSTFGLGDFAIGFVVSIALIGSASELFGRATSVDNGQSLAIALAGVVTLSCYFLLKKALTATVHD